ncbi:MAG: radical SAM family heme chaperone HemW [Longimicrobiales bacterium]
MREIRFPSPPLERAGTDEGPIRSLYVHAPFCARRCLYCDFAVTVSRLGDLGGWLAALERELALREREGTFSLAPALQTLFVGGGTPSILGPSAMAGLARLLGPGRLLHPELEWTAEANPESFSPEVSEDWSRAGLNRISLGVQSFQEGPLKWMGRLHGPEGAGQAVKRARAAGIGNVSLDLIFGLPDGIERDWSADLDSALALEVPHLSLYGLTVEEGTPLGRAVAEGSAAPAQEGRYREEFLLASERLTEAGYRQYELSNFALPGFESRHNQACWELRPYLGIGPSAHSYRDPVRRWNLKEWREYQKAVLGGEDPMEGQEELTPESRRLERIWLALRTDSGIPLAGLSIESRELAGEWVRKGWGILRAEALCLTPEGWLLLDRLAVELDGSEGPVLSSP